VADNVLQQEDLHLLLSRLEGMKTVANVDGTGLSEGIKARPDKRREGVCAQCGRQPAGGVGLKRCAACQCVFYCRAECQKAHWKAHKVDCKQLRQEREAYKAGK